MATAAPPKRALSYAELRRLQESLGLDSMSSQDFSTLLQTADPQRDYSAGQGGGLGKALKGVSYGIDQLLESTGLPELAQRGGEAVGGDTLGQAARQLPRGVADLATMFIPGGTAVKAASLGTAFGTNTYEKTNSPAAGAISGVLSTLFPAAARVGGRLGGRVGAALGVSQEAVPATAIGAAGNILRNEAATKAVGEGTARLLNEAALMSRANRLSVWGGEQAGLFGANLGASAITAGVAAPKGQGWEAFTDALSPEHIAVTAAMQLPFMPGSFIRTVKTPQAVKFAREYGQAIKDYDTTYNTVKESLDERILRMTKQLPEKATTQMPPEPLMNPTQRQLEGKLKSLQNFEGSTRLFTGGRQGDLSVEDLPTSSTGRRLPVGLETGVSRLRESTRYWGVPTTSVPELAPPVTASPRGQVARRVLSKLGVEDSTAQVLGERIAQDAPDFGNMEDFRTHVIETSKVRGIEFPGEVSGRPETNPEIFARAGWSSEDLPFAVERSGQINANIDANIVNNNRRIVGEWDAGQAKPVEPTMPTPTPPEVIEAALEHPDPVVRVEAAREVVPDDPTPIIESKVSSGLPIEEAVQDVAATTVARAKEVVKRRRSKWDAKNEENFAWVDTQKGTEHYTEFDNFLKAHSQKLVSLPKHATTSLLSAYKKWFDNGMQGTLGKALQGQLKLLDQTPNVASSRTNVTSYRNGRFTVGEGKAHLFATRDEARLAADTLLAAEPQYTWTVAKDGAGFKVVRAERDVVMQSLPNQEVIPTADTLIGAAERPEHKESIRVAFSDESPTAFAERMPEDLATYFGDGDAMLGRKRVDSFLALAKARDVRAAGKMVEQGLFEDPEAAQAFMRTALGNDVIKDFVTAKPLRIGDATGSSEVERATLGRLLQHAGLTAPQHLNEAARILSLADAFEGQLFGRIVDPKGAGAVGGFRLADSRVLLAARPNAPQELFLALAHELHGHGLWEAHKSGLLTAEDSAKLQRFSELVEGNTIEQNKALVEEFLQMVPKEYADLKQLIRESSLKPLSKETPDFDEILANVNAATVLGLAKSGGRMKDFLTWMPKPVGDFVTVAARYARRMWEAISGLFHLRSLGDTKKLWSDRDAMHTYIDDLKGILRYSAENEARAQEYLRAQLLADGESLGTALGNTDVLSQYLNKSTDATNEVVKYLKLEDIEDTKTPIGKASRWYDRTLKLFTQFGQKFPELRGVTTVAVKHQAEFNRFMDDAMKEYGLVRQGVQYTGYKDTPSYKVEVHPGMSKTRDDAIRLAATKDTSVKDLLASGDTEMATIFSKSSPENKQLVLESIAQMEGAQLRATEKYREFAYRRLENQAAELLLLQKAAPALEMARQQAGMAIAAHRAGAAPASPDALSELISGSIKAIENNYNLFSSRPWFVTEQRMGALRLRVDYANGTHKIITANSAPEAKLLTEQLKADNSVTKYTDLDAGKGIGRNVQLDAAIDKVIAMEETALSGRIQQLVNAGVAPDVAERVLRTDSFAESLKREQAAKSLPTAKIKRRFAAGREDLDMLEQQIQYVQRVGYAMTKSVSNSEFNSWLADPKVANHPEKATLQQSWKNYMTPDPAAVRHISGLNWTAYLGANFFNMLQDAVQPLMGALPSGMVNEGGGVVASYKGVLAAMKDRGTGKVTSEERSMLDWFKKGNAGLGMYSDEVNNGVLAAVDARRIAEGKEPTSLTKALTQPLKSLVLRGKGLHKIFTDFGAESGMLASYRHYRRQGLDHSAAQNAAFELVAQNMYIGGKANRPVGAWNDGRQTASALLLGLQTFALGTVGNMKTLGSRALGRVEGITGLEQKQAAKAFATAITSQVAFAGVLGLPFVAATLIGLEKVFGIKAREAVTSFLQDVDEDDDSPSLLGQIATHGALNQLGADVAARTGTTGVLGLNPYSGFDPWALAGPTAKLVENAVTGLAQVAQGEVSAGLMKGAPIPNTFKRIAKMYQDDGDFRDSDGTLMQQGTGGQAALYAVMGLKPESLARLEEARALQRAGSSIDAANRSQWVENVVESYLSGDVNTVRQAISERAAIDARSADDKTAVELGLAQAVARKLEDRAFSYDPRSAEGNSGTINALVGDVLPPPSELQRLEYSQHVLESLGLATPMSPRRLQQAQELDNLLLSDPFMSRSEGQSLLQSLIGRRRSRSPGNSALSTLF